MIRSLLLLPSILSMTLQKPIQNVGVVDDYGEIAYFTKYDLQSSDFIFRFLDGFNDNYSEKVWSTDSTSTFTYSLSSDQGYNGTFYSISNTGVMNENNPLVSATIHIQKQSVTLRTTATSEYYDYRFVIRMVNASNSNILVLTYYIAIPLLDFNEHDLGRQLYYVNTTASSSLSTFTRYVYVENTNNSSAPIWQYYKRSSSSDFNKGYNLGYDEGNNRGYINGYDIGYNEGLTNGSRDGYTEGYTQAINDYGQGNAQEVALFTGILNVGLLPVNIFLQMFNFEVFGVNISGLISAFLTISAVIIIIRLLTGKKND